MRSENCANSLLIAGSGDSLVCKNDLNSPIFRPAAAVLLSATGLESPYPNGWTKRRRSNRAPRPGIELQSLRVVHQAAIFSGIAGLIANPTLGRANRWCSLSLLPFAHAPLRDRLPAGGINNAAVYSEQDEIVRTVS